MKYKMLYTKDMIYVELEGDEDGWNLIYSSSSGWYMAHLNDNEVTDYFVDFNTLSDEELFQQQLVIDTGGYDVLLLKKIQKAVMNFNAQVSEWERKYYDLEVQ
ncbi:hypothetical protein A4_343 [Escherichia phage A4]|nr:hypothetical protein A4_343 [Escherichia phage A4]